MGRNEVKTGRIYMKLNMSIFIRKNFSYPPKVFFSETVYFELSKNLVICFEETLTSLLLDTTKSSHSGLLVLNLRQRILPLLLKLQISENYLNPPKTICKHPKPSTTIQSHPPKNCAIALNQPSPLKAIGRQPEST